MTAETCRAIWYDQGHARRKQPPRRHQSAAQVRRYRAQRLRNRIDGIRLVLPGGLKSPIARSNRSIRSCRRTAWRLKTLRMQEQFRSSTWRTSRSAIPCSTRRMRSGTGKTSRWRTASSKARLPRVVQRNLRLVRCKIIGTQPFCCEESVLEDCEMIDCDLAFENTTVEADVRGEILSVKNPAGGHHGGQHRRSCSTSTAGRAPRARSPSVSAKGREPGAPKKTAQEKRGGLRNGGRPLCVCRLSRRRSWRGRAAVTAACARPSAGTGSQCRFRRTPFSRPR